MSNWAQNFSRDVLCTFHEIPVLILLSDLTTSRHECCTGGRPTTFQRHFLILMVNIRQTETLLKLWLKIGVVQDQMSGTTDIGSC